MPAPEPPGGPGQPGRATDPIAALLAGTYPDPDGGGSLGTSIAVIEVADSLAGAEAELVARAGPGGHLVVVSDVDTAAALGDRVAASLAGAARVSRVTLGRRPHADADTLARLLAAIEPGCDGVVAVGSGTINDLCKLAAQARALPQVVFATAPSMNGYASVSASLVEGGLKRSIRARAPVGVFVDLAVLAAAPTPLLRAGLGDSLCRPTAQRDWLLQHRLLGRPYRRAPFALLAADEAVVMAGAAALLAGDLDVMRALARTLILSGLGMTLCDGSFPASQGEHLLAHTLEMLGADPVPPRLHGEQIGVTTLTMARLQDQVLARPDPPALGRLATDEAALVAWLGPELGPTCWDQLAGKRLDGARLDAVNHALATGWDGLRAELAGLGPGAPALAEILEAAGAPTHPGQVGWADAAYRDAARGAHLIRDRFTFLDLAALAGVAFDPLGDPRR